MSNQTLIKIKTIFNNYKNLAASDLKLQNKEYIHKINELVDDLEYKLELKEQLDGVIEQLKKDVSSLEGSIEILDIDLIRSKQESKRVKKNVDKLKALNMSSVKIELNDNDKMRMQTAQAKIFLVRLLTQIIGVNDRSKFLLRDKSFDGNEVKAVQLKSNAKEINTENLWNQIESCSNQQQWMNLFFS